MVGGARSESERLKGARLGEEEPAKPALPESPARINHGPARGRTMIWIGHGRLIAAGGRRGDDEWMVNGDEDATGASRLGTP